MSCLAGQGVRAELVDARNWEGFLGCSGEDFWLSWVTWMGADDGLARREGTHPA